MHPCTCAPSSVRSESQLSCARTWSWGVFNLPRLGRQFVSPMTCLMRIVSDSWSGFLLGVMSDASAMSPPPKELNSSISSPSGGPEESKSSLDMYACRCDGGCLAQVARKKNHYHSFMPTDPPADPPVARPARRPSIVYGVGRTNRQRAVERGSAAAVGSVPAADSIRRTAVRLVLLGVFLGLIGPYVWRYIASSGRSEL